MNRELFRATPRVPCLAPAEPFWVLTRAPPRRASHGSSSSLDAPVPNFERVAAHVRPGRRHACGVQRRFIGRSRLHFCASCAFSDARANCQHPTADRLTRVFPSPRVCNRTRSMRFGRSRKRSSTIRKLSSATRIARWRRWKSGIKWKSKCTSRR